MKIATYGICSRLPVSRADLAVCVRKLEGLHEAQRLIDWSADGKVVHRDLTQDALLVNDKQASEIEWPQNTLQDWLLTSELKLSVSDFSTIITNQMLTMFYSCTIAHCSILSILVQAHLASKQFGHDFISLVIHRHTILAFH